MIPNSVLRVMSDANAGLAYLTLLYIDWLAKQLMPDTAETEWLDRFGTIWLTQGRKTATYATAQISFTGLAGTVLPAGNILTGATLTGANTNVSFQTQADITVSSTPAIVNILAVSPGVTSVSVGSTLSLAVGISGVDGTGTITQVTNGIDQETDDELRARVLDRIRQPPMGGDAEDYVQWAEATPGVNVTRAWCSPNEMGIGTVTVRFMTDDLENEVVGFPTTDQINAVIAQLNTKRPVAVKDWWVEAPVPEPINFTVTISPDTVSNRNGIASSVASMLFNKAAPAHAINGVGQSAQIIYRAWVSEAISAVGTIDHFTLTMSDHVMPVPGSLAVLGTITYD